MSHKERVDGLWVEIQKRFTYGSRGSEGAVKRLLSKALREVAWEAVAAHEKRTKKPRGGKL